MDDIMNYQWMPRKILSKMNFMFWEVDEIIAAFFGAIISITSGKWWWAGVGFGISYLYSKYYKKSALRIVWKDFFFAAGIFDLKGYPQGTKRFFVG